MEWICVQRKRPQTKNVIIVNHHHGLETRSQTAKTSIYCIEFVESVSSLDFRVLTRNRNSKPDPNPIHTRTLTLILTLTLTHTLSLTRVPQLDNFGLKINESRYSMGDASSSFATRQFIDHRVIRNSTPQVWTLFKRRLITTFKTRNQLHKSIHKS